MTMLQTLETTERPWNKLGHYQQNTLLITKIHLKTYYLTQYTSLEALSSWVWFIYES